MHSRVIRRALALACAVTLLIMPMSGCGGDPASAVLVGSVLNELTSDVDNIVRNAGSEARATTLATAAAVQDAIDNAESAFAEDLNKSIDKVDESTRTNIIRLQALVAQLQSGAQEILKAAAADAQQLINTLPFTNRNPQVTRYTPAFVAKGGAPSVQVRIEGNFVFAFEKKRTPTLRVGDQTFEPNLNTTQELGYTIPMAALPSGPPKELTSISMELNAPYEKGAIFKKQDLGIFRLLVTVLPVSPVEKLTLVNQVTTKGTESHTISAPQGAPGVTWDLNSFDCQPHTRTEEIAASPGGWDIVPSTAGAIVTWNKNPEAADVETSANQSSVTTVGRTRPACFLGICNGCGRISWYVSYTETRDVESTADEQAELSLHWGDQIVISVTPNKWRLEATLFDGRAFHVATTDVSNQYLSVHDLGSKISIQTPATDGFFKQ